MGQGICFEYELHFGVFLFVLNVVYFLIKRRSAMNGVKDFLTNKQSIMKQTKDVLVGLSTATMEAIVHISRPVVGIALYA